MAKLFRGGVAIFWHVISQKNLQPHDKEKLSSTFKNSFTTQLPTIFLAPHSKIFPAPLVAALHHNSMSLVQLQLSTLKQRVTRV